MVLLWVDGRRIVGYPPHDDEVDGARGAYVHAEGDLAVGVHGPLHVVGPGQVLQYGPGLVDRLLKERGK